MGGLAGFARPTPSFSPQLRKSSVIYDFHESISPSHPHCPDEEVF